MFKILSVLPPTKEIPITSSHLHAGVELQCFPQHQLEEQLDEQIEEVKRSLGTYQGMIALHGSSYDLNPGSMDPKVIELTKYRYLQSIQISQSLNAQYVIFHSTMNPLLKATHIRKNKLDNQILFWKDLINEIKDTHITILLENEYDETHEEILYLINEVNSQQFKVCFDVGHALAYSKQSLEKWISYLGEEIAYIHLHFNDGVHDLHRSPTNEEITNFFQILEKKHLNPIITLEYHVHNLNDELTRINELLEGIRE